MTTFAAHIPTITALRDALQYGDVRLPRCDAFNDTLLVFRKNYVTSTGLRGSDIHDWKSAEHQGALTEMSHAFLDRDGNGEFYWPTDTTSPNINNLQYSTQQSLIRELIKQLIYRLNLQQYRNAKYKRKCQPRDEDHSSLPQHAYHSIEISSDEGPSTLPRDTTTARVNAPKTQPTHEAQRRITSKSRAAGPFTESLPTLSIPNDEEDMFAVPDSPEFASPDDIQAPKRRIRKVGNSQLPKRTKYVPRKPVQRVGVRNDCGLSVAAKRTSPREPKTIPRPERVPTDELNSAIASPTYTPTSRTIRQTPEDLINYIRNNRPFITSGTSTAAESHNVPHDSQTEPPIDPVLEQLVPSRDSQLSQSQDDIRSIHSHYTNVTTQANSHNTSISVSPTTLLRTFQNSKEKTTAESNTTSAPRLVSGSNSTPVNASKPNVEFTYRIILARKPIYQYENWKLKGNFQDKSLAELKTELPIKGGYESLILRLQGPGTFVEETIRCDREEQFTGVKRQFNKVVRSLALNQVRTKPGETLSIEFEIEPLRIEENVEEDDEAELADFTW